MNELRYRILPGSTNQALLITRQNLEIPYAPIVDIKTSQEQTLVLSDLTGDMTVNANTDTPYVGDILNFLFKGDGVHVVTFGTGLSGSVTLGITASGYSAAASFIFDGVCWIPSMKGLHIDVIGTANEIAYFDNTGVITSDSTATRDIDKNTVISRDLLVTPDINENTGLLINEVLEPISTLFGENLSGSGLYYKYEDSNTGDFNYNAITTANSDTAFKGLFLASLDSNKGISVISSGYNIGSGVRGKWMVDDNDTGNTTDLHLDAAGGNIGLFIGGNNGELNSLRLDINYAELKCDFGNDIIGAFNINNGGAYINCSDNINDNRFSLTPTSAYLSYLTANLDNSGIYTPNNFIYTDMDGRLLSGPISSIKNKLYFEKATSAIPPQVDGNDSVAIGAATNNKADNSIAIGGYIDTGANYSYTLGGTANAPSTVSIKGTANGTSSIAIGGASNGVQSIAIGMGGISSVGDNSLALGTNGISAAYGEQSIVLGNSITAYSYSETVIGKGNTVYTPSNTANWDSFDRLFVVGGSPSDPGSGGNKDAFTILKNGKVGIGINNFENTTLNEVLQVLGSANFSAVPDYADDAAASSGGLSSGSLYKTTTGGSTFLKIVP